MVYLWLHSRMRSYSSMKGCCQFVEIVPSAFIMECLFCCDSSKRTLCKAYAATITRQKTKTTSLFVHDSWIGFVWNFCFEGQTKVVRYIFGHYPAFWFRINSIQSHYCFLFSLCSWCAADVGLSQHSGNMTTCEHICERNMG